VSHSYFACISALGLIEEIERIFGEDGFNGNLEEYDWLLEHYGVTEYEDVCWQFIIDAIEELSDEEPNDIELIEFLDDDNAADIFLAKLLKKYKSNTLTCLQLLPGNSLLILHTSFPPFC
jgi:hypothetical protein